MKIVIMSIVFMLTACSMSMTSVNNIVVEGDKPTAEKEKIASAVMEVVWNGSLKDDIRSEYPNITPEELETSLGMKWSTTTFQSIVDEEKTPKDVVRISCIFKSKDIDVANKITSLCAKKIENELSKYY